MFFHFFSFFLLLFNLVVKDPSEKLSFMVDHFVFFKGLINEYVNMYRKKQKPISPSWKRETAFLLPWKTLELLVFGTCATGILRLAFLIDFIFHSNLLASISKSFCMGFLSSWSFRFWPNNKSRMYLLENTGGHLIYNINYKAFGKYIALILIHVPIFQEILLKQTDFKKEIS